MQNQEQKCVDLTIDDFLLVLDFSLVWQREISLSADLNAEAVFEYR